MDSAEDRCRRLLEAVAQRAGVAVPDISMTADRLAQAGLGDHGGIVVSYALADLLPDDELQATLAHELAHIVLGHEKPDADDPRGAQQDERAADRLSVSWIGDPEPLCRALVRIDARNRAREGAPTGARRSAHPPLRKRLPWIRSDARSLMTATPSLAL